MERKSPRKKSAARKLSSPRKSPSASPRGKSSPRKGGYDYPKIPNGMQFPTETLRFDKTKKNEGKLAKLIPFLSSQHIEAVCKPLYWDVILRNDPLNDTLTGEYLVMPLNFTERIKNCKERFMFFIYLSINSPNKKYEYVSSGGYEEKETILNYGGPGPEINAIIEKQLPSTFRKKFEHKSNSKFYYRIASKIPSAFHNAFRVTILTFLTHIRLLNADYDLDKVATYFESFKAGDWEELLPRYQGYIDKLKDVLYTYATGLSKDVLADTDLLL